jgi:AraC-like DNA-binding protein
MYQSLVSMDWNQMKSILKTSEIRANVRIANHHPVPANMVWERSIPDPQIVCILDGFFDYQDSNDPPLRLRPGDFLFIAPNVRHRLSFGPAPETHEAGESAHQEGAIAGMHFEFSPAGSWAAGDYELAMKPKTVTRVDDTAYLQDRFKQLAAVFESYRPYRKALVNTMATEIILLMAAYWEGEIIRAVHPSQRMESILTYIREHLTEPLTRQSLAETFSLSAGYVNQIFKVELGMSPTAVINRERAARAYQLMLQEGSSVRETAQAVGFQDPFYFSRVFKQIYSIPPSQVAPRR